MRIGIVACLRASDTFIKEYELRSIHRLSVVINIENKETAI